MGSDERQQEEDQSFLDEQHKHFNIRKSPFYRKQVTKGKSLAGFQKPQSKIQMLFHS